jgi:SAM-dependent methyltransferase
MCAKRTDKLFQQRCVTRLAWTFYTSLAILMSSASIATAQSGTAPRQPDVSYVATTKGAVQMMLKLADVKKSDIVYDLGCGDGRIVIAAAKIYGARGVGIDIDPRRIRESKNNAKKAGVESLVRFEQNDLFKADIHEATVVTLFLLSTLNFRLLPKLLQDLQPGTRIVSNSFSMGGWPPDKEVTVETSRKNDLLSRKLYLWVVPSRFGKIVSLVPFVQPPIVPRNSLFEPNEVQVADRSSEAIAGPATSSQDDAKAAGLRFMNHSTGGLPLAAVLLDMILPSRASLFAFSARLIQRS